MDAELPLKIHPNQYWFYARNSIDTHEDNRDWKGDWKGKSENQTGPPEIGEEDHRGQGYSPHSNPALWEEYRDLPNKE